jgi:hypothetical protein
MVAAMIAIRMRVAVGRAARSDHGRKSRRLIAAVMIAIA